MKIRTGFVSNSSSSSFVCDLCGRTETGWDISLEEAEMIECVNGHVICVDEMVEDFPKNELPSVEKQTKILLEYWEYDKDDDPRYYKLKSGNMTEEEIAGHFEDYRADYEQEHMHEMEEKYCPICQMIEFANKDLGAYLLKKTGITEDEVFAIVKAANKRRKKLYDNEYVMYALQKSNMEMSVLVTEIREKFKTYKEFKEYTR